MTRVLPILRKAVCDKDHAVFYMYGPRQGRGQADPAVSVYQTYAEIPHRFRGVLVGSRFTNIMYYRLQSGRAKVLAYSEDGVTLQAYGWIQSWAPFKRRFKVFAEDGWVLGPYWTSPDYRRRGLYGRLLRHSLYMLPADTAALIYAAPGNTTSRRGITSAGFESLGEWVISTWLGCLVRARRIDG